MSGHTPGPWTIVPGDMRVSSRHITAKTERGYIAEIYGYTKNDLLISAAPELLEALKIAMQFLPLKETPKPVMDTLNEAIAKAEGK